MQFVVQVVANSFEVVILISLKQENISINIPLMHRLIILLIETKNEKLLFKIS